MKYLRLLSLLILFFIVHLSYTVNAQPKRGQRSVVLTAEDSLAFPSAPVDFNQRRENILAWYNQFDSI